MIHWMKPRQPVFVNLVLRIDDSIRISKRRTHWSMLNSTKTVIVVPNNKHNVLKTHQIKMNPFCTSICVKMFIISNE